MIERALSSVIKQRLKSFPAVALLGPRQSGKTTLACTFSSTYYDLELEEERLRLDLQWQGIITSSSLAVLDEAQNFPALFPRLRSAIDKNRKRNGRFLLLGSIAPGLMKEVSEFLTGRIAICELSPLSITEMNSKQDDQLWRMGGYPDGGILHRGNFSAWQQNYLDVLAMRDLPAWGLPSSSQITKRFFKILAASHGSIWNASQIGKSLGISYHTANSYLDYLEQAYLIRRLPPYHSNIKKRLIKSPKIYWRDSGLLHSLLNATIHTMDDLLSQPWVGVSWEGWVIEQIHNFLLFHGIDSGGMYYFRTSDQHELDLVLTLSGKIWAIEIKLTAAPGSWDMDRLKKTAALINADKIILLSRTATPIVGKNVSSLNLRSLLDLLKLSLNKEKIKRRA